MNRMDRGDCESATSPMVSGETVPILGYATWARDSAFAYAGSYSYKYIKTSNAGMVSYINLVDSENTTDMHGLLAGLLHTFPVQLYIPSVSGILGTEIRLQLYDYMTSWANTLAAASNLYDQWQLLTVARTLRATATGTIVRISTAITAALNEYFYMDNIQLIDSMAYGVVSASLAGKAAGATFAGNKVGISLTGKRAEAAFVGE